MALNTPKTQKMAEEEKLRTEEGEREFLNKIDSALNYAIIGRNFFPLKSLLLEMKREIDSKANRKDFNRYRQKISYDPSDR